LAVCARRGVWRLFVVICGTSLWCRLPACVLEQGGSLHHNESLHPAARGSPLAVGPRPRHVAKKSRLRYDLTCGDTPPNSDRRHAHQSLVPTAGGLAVPRISVAI